MSSEEEEYEFEYSDEDEEMDEAEVDVQVRLENQYYLAKQFLEETSSSSSSHINTKYQEAKEALEKVVQMEIEEQQKGDWGFKALKRIVKIHFTLNELDKAMVKYEQLLGYTKSAVTRNVGEKGINSILDFVSNHSNQKFEILQHFYEKTLETLKEAKNERLWFKTNLKLGNLLYESGDFIRLNKIIKDLLNSCEDMDSIGRGRGADGIIQATEESSDNIKKHTQLLEVYALQIQMYTAQKDNNKLYSMYEKALRTKSGVAHPKIIGVIRECGGKMHMMKHDWDKARSDFFEGFKNYDEAGETRRLQCLKYLVLANMLSESKVNVFDSQEAKPYENDKEIVAMTKLTEAFLHDDIKQFEQVLKQNRHQIMDDPFIKHYIDNLLQTIRSKVLLKIVQPYQQMKLQYLSKELNQISIKEVENLIASLILDQKIHAKIDQVQQKIVLLKDKPGQKNGEEDKFAFAMEKWSQEIQKVHTKVVERVNLM